MAKTMHLKRPDGQDLPAFQIEGASPSAPGIVLIQEWWGLNEQIKSVGSRLAELGYRVLLPDLFRGMVTQNADEANQWMNGLDFPDAVHQDIRGCAQFLKKTSAKVAVLGFCMGGALTIASAVHVPEADAAVCFYGIPPLALADPAKIRVPIQLHFANIDGWCTPDAVSALEKTLQSSAVEFELYRYEAQHAFFNDKRPEVYDPKSAQQAWERSTAFLKKNL